MESVEWVSVSSSTTATVLGPQDEANDYQTPAEGDETDTTTHGLAIHNGMNGICLTGPLDQIHTFLRSALEAVEAERTPEETTTGERGTVESSTTATAPASTVDRLYMNHNGMVTCLTHGGDYLSNAVQTSPGSERYQTPLDAWVQFTGALGRVKLYGVGCETCGATL